MDGLINCLLQPGLLLDQPLKSIRTNSFQLIKFCGTLTVPAAETKSIGLQTDARVVMVFASPSGQFYCNMTNPAHFSGQHHLDSFIVTLKSLPLTGTLQKRMPTLTPRLRRGRLPATQLNRRAVRLKLFRYCSVPNHKPHILKEILCQKPIKHI